MSRAKRDKDINTANNRIIRSCKRDIIYMDGQDEHDEQRWIWIYLRSLGHGTERIKCYKYVKGQAPTSGMEEFRVTARAWVPRHGLQAPWGDISAEFAGGHKGRPRGPHRSTIGHGHGMRGKRKLILV